jgi:hypothetical protein
MKRASALFSEVLNELVEFSVAYLRLSKNTALCGTLFDMMFSEGSELTLAEQLSVLKQLNPLLFQRQDQKYWQLIKEGLQDIDQVCRKQALHVLKENLKLLADEKAKGTIKLHCSEKDYEQLWTTFFDVYDTLESFGSHLTKAIWHRVDAFYDHLRTSDTNDLYVQEDFKAWLLVIYNRVASHCNLKIRKFVQKVTLKRPFITH